jgi:hypothetical protein
MKALLGFTAGTLVALIAATYLAPQQTIIHTDTIVEERIIVEQVMTTLDLDQIRDTNAIDPDLELELLAECAYAIQRQTNEPLQGIIHYLERHWQADSCAAYEHLARHGWY